MTICLQLDHVNYSYGAAKIRVLSDVNADFESGKMYAITGPSGAGKSTLLSLLAGLDTPSDGVVRFEGEDIATTGYSKHRRERRESAPGQSQGRYEDPRGSGAEP